MGASRPSDRSRSGTPTTRGSWPRHSRRAPTSSSPATRISWTSTPRSGLWTWSRRGGSGSSAAGAVASGGAESP